MQFFEVVWMTSRECSVDDEDEGVQGGRLEVGGRFTRCGKGSTAKLEQRWDTMALTGHVVQPRSACETLLHWLAARPLNRYVHYILEGILNICAYKTFKICTRKQVSGVSDYLKVSQKTVLFFRSSVCADESQHIFENQQANLFYDQISLENIFGGKFFHCHIDLRNH